MAFSWEPVKTRAQTFSRLDSLSLFLFFQIFSRIVLLSFLFYLIFALDLDLDLQCLLEKKIRPGTLWTCIAHIITAVIGSGVLSLAWSTAQLGWVGGPVSLLCFAVVTYLSAFLLSDCYRSPDPVTGSRNYTYMDAVRVNLGSIKGPSLCYSILLFSTRRYRHCCRNCSNNFAGVCFLAYLIWLSASSGRKHTWVCGFLQYLSLYGTCIAYTITTSISMRY